jgi:signal transduction histidine kinase
VRARFFDKCATHGKENGSGLGTYSARLIAQAHGGSIAMPTSEQDGTTLTIQLPG